MARCIETMTPYPGDMELIRKGIGVKLHMSTGSFQLKYEHQLEDIGGFLKCQEWGNHSFVIVFNRHVHCKSSSYIGVPPS